MRTNQAKLRTVGIVNPQTTCRSSRWVEIYFFAVLMLTFSVRRIVPFHFPHTTHDQPTRCGAFPRRELANCCDKSLYLQALTCNSMDGHQAQLEKLAQWRDILPKMRTDGLRFPDMQNIFVFENLSFFMHRRWKLERRECGFGPAPIRFSGSHY